MRHHLIVGLAALVLAVGTAAQSFNYTTFNGTTPVTLNGNAAPSGGAVRLTPATLSTKGSMFLQTPVQVGYGFDMTFGFKITVAAGSSGADGLTFVIHNDARGDTFLGNHAGALGYAAFLTSPIGTGCQSALVIELDTFSGSFNGNSDASGNEISVHTNGTGEVSHDEGQSIGRIALSTATANLSNGLVHTLRVLYLPGTLDLFLDGALTPTLSIPYDMVSGGTHILSGNPVGGLGLTNGMAWIGFTASCGGVTETHDITSWSFNSFFPPTYPGNNSDFDCRLTVNGTVDATSTRVISVNALDAIGLNFNSPLGGTDGQLFSAFYQLFVTGTPLVSQVIPGEAPPGGFWLDAAGGNPGAVTGVVPYIDGLGLGGPTFLAPFVLPGGYDFGFAVPAIVGGQGVSLMLQAIVLDPGLNGLNLGIDDCIELQIN